jgi:hypothetical protein
MGERRARDSLPVSGWGVRGWGVGDFASRPQLLLAEPRSAEVDFLLLARRRLVAHDRHRLGTAQFLA